MSTPIFDNSIFGSYFSFHDPELQIWVRNVLKKLRAKGYVAEFVERDFEDSDADFDAVFEPTIKFFGYLVRLAREFEGFKNNQFLSDQYLQNKGLYTCGDETLDELLYAITNLLRRRSQRGTIKSIEPDSTGMTIDGEILNLLCWNELTIFILGVARPQFNSINIDHSSPCFRGATNRYDLNVAWEYTEDVKDLSKYPLLNSQYININRYNSKDSMKIELPPIGVEAGIGAIDFNKKIIVNPNLNYEITFYVAQNVTFENITFGVKCYDFANSLVQTKDIVNGANRNFFFETRRLNQADQFYFIRGIIFNKDESNRSIEDARLNIGFGGNLKFPPEAVSIIPYIVCDNKINNDIDSESDNFDSESIDFDVLDSNDFSDSESFSSYEGFPAIYLWNIKVNPCSLDYERSYLNNKNFIDIISSNRNGDYSIQEIKTILRKYFIPYNTAFNILNLPRVIENFDNAEFILTESESYILLENGDKILLEIQP